MAYSIQYQFFNACQNGDTQEALRLLGKTGKRADCKASDDYGNTALMIAADNLHADCVNALLPHSDCKASNNCGTTALMWAARHGNTETASLIEQYIIAQDVKVELGRDGIPVPAPAGATENAPVAKSTRIRV